MSAAPAAPDWLARALALDPERGADQLFAERRARLGLSVPARKARVKALHALLVVREKLWNAEPAELRTELSRLDLGAHPDWVSYSARLARLIDLRPQFEAARADGSLASGWLEDLRELMSTPPEEKLGRSEQMLRSLEVREKRNLLQKSERKLARDHAALHALEPRLFARIRAFDERRQRSIRWFGRNPRNWQQWLLSGLLYGVIRLVIKLVVGLMFPDSKHP